MPPLTKKNRTMKFRMKKNKKFHKPDKRDELLLKINKNYKNQSKIVYNSLRFHKTKRKVKLHKFNKKIMMLQRLEEEESFKTSKQTN